MLRNILLLLTTLAGMILVFAVFVFLWTRIFYGIPFIVDRQMNCLDAARASWYYTRGNIKILTFRKGGRIASDLVILALFFLTFGASLIGYMYCSVIVTYLMLTGQCELLEEQPDEW